MGKALELFFKENNKLALAFSGGSDSAYLLYEAAKAGADVTAYFVRSQFQPQFEYEDAVKVIRWLEENLGAGEVGAEDCAAEDWNGAIQIEHKEDCAAEDWNGAIQIEHKEDCAAEGRNGAIQIEHKEDCAAEDWNGAIQIEHKEDCAAEDGNGAINSIEKRNTFRTPVLKVLDLDILALDSVRKNGDDRCYHCKKAIMQAIREQASLDGYSMIIDGNNASDVALERPGMRATAELGVRSPLRELGVGKAEVRRLSEQAGLPTWNKPAYACLATRIKTGEIITEDKLATTEKSESILHEMGFTDFRIRIHEMGFTDFRIRIHEMGFTDFRIRMHEMGNSDFRIRIHEMGNSSCTTRMHEMDDSNCSARLHEMDSCSTRMHESRAAEGCFGIVQTRPEQAALLQENKSRIIAELSELYREIKFENR